MKLKSVMMMLLIVAASALMTSRVISQDAGEKDPKHPQDGPPDMAAMMEWMKLTQPGEHHQDLNQFVGQWNMTTKMWMIPGAPPSVSKGTVKYKMIMDGRFLSEEVSAEIDMGPMGKQPFEGFGLTGYDKVRSLYTSCWVANQDTQMMISKGTRHPETGVYTFYGERDDPRTNIYGGLVKWRIRFSDKDHFVSEMFNLAAGEDERIMEIAYTRAKSSS
ncbi:MAG: DUF1579 family protein [Phycisphaerae bacterium]